MDMVSQVVFLRGERVNLRPLERSDLARITRWINDPEVRYYLDAYLPMSESEEEEWLEDLGKRKPNDIVLAIVTTQGEHIGNIALHRINWRDRTAITGTVIGEKRYWNQGLGTEAKMLLLDYAFNTLNLRRILSQVLAFNERSITYSKKCGYVEEGRLRLHIFRNGQYHDVVNLGVFREEFETAHVEWFKGKDLTE